MKNLRLKLTISMLFLISISEFSMAFTPPQSFMQKKISFLLQNAIEFTMHKDVLMTVDGFVKYGFKDETTKNWSKYKDGKYILTILSQDDFAKKSLKIKILFDDLHSPDRAFMSRVIMNDKELDTFNRYQFLEMFAYGAVEKKRKIQTGSPRKKVYIDTSTWNESDGIVEVPQTNNTVHESTSEDIISLNKYSKTFNICMDKSDGVTSSMRECHKAELSLQDKRLNQNYRKLMRVLDANKKVEMKKVQRSWIKYRNMRCGFYYGLTGGTMDLLIGDGCILDMTIEKANELLDISSDIGG